MDRIVLGIVLGAGAVDVNVDVDVAYVLEGVVN
jgi:hypothetical protein